MRILNRNQHSAWEAITSGMLGIGQPFSKANLYVNFQLTKSKGELVKMVRDAKKKKEVNTYVVDENGRLTAKRSALSRWVQLNTKADLAALLASPRSSSSAPRPGQFIHANANQANLSRRRNTAAA